MRRVARNAIAVITLLAGSAGCGESSVTAPSLQPFVGRWVLARVNGRPLPYGTDVIGGTLELQSSGEYISAISRQIPNGFLNAGTFATNTTRGTYVVSNGAVILSSPGSVSISGTVDPRSLSLIDATHGLTYEFAR